jgi:rhodanese-related sulfurtransferase
MNGTLRTLAALTALAALALAGPKVRKLEPREVSAMLREGRKVVFLDARERESSNRIPGSVLVPRDRVDAWAAGADKEALVVAYCA